MLLTKEPRKLFFELLTNAKNTQIVQLYEKVTQGLQSQLL